MIAGRDFPDYFAVDRFAERRGGSAQGVKDALPVTGTVFLAGNPYDPESLLSGREMAAGLSYRDKRWWFNESEYLQAVGGEWSTDKVLALAPRVSRTAGPVASYSDLRELSEVDLEDSTDD